MQTKRGKQFKALEPKITHEDINEAQVLNRNVSSFDIRPVSDERVDFVAFKLALADGTTTTILFDELVGRSLWAFLQRLGELDWGPKAAAKTMH